jgi:predicted protein tyrosine phosphatase
MQKIKDIGKGKYPKWVISIAGPNNLPLYATEGTRLGLVFVDTTNPYDEKAFTKEQAKQIIEFLVKYSEANKWNTEELYIHCAAGVSRSGAVGLFATEFLGLSERQFFSTNRQVSPNPYVLRILRETLEEEMLRKEILKGVAECDAGLGVPIEQVKEYLKARRKKNPE